MLVGSRNERLLKQLQKTVSQINALEPQWQALSDPMLQAKTAEFRERLAQQVPLDSLIPEAFATVREASRRVLQMCHFDVQLIGGLVLHRGKIAEMRTGEGKTLVATLPAYLNALVGKGLHIVTVNDYLAGRDAEWMGPLYRFLGLSVGVIKAGLNATERQAAYAADITYGTNNEFGFDYLRDNMALSLGERVQRGLYEAIADEIDCALIDEARTPLIISGPSDESSDYYTLINHIVPQLKRAKEEVSASSKLNLLERKREADAVGDFILDEKAKQAHLTEQGHQKLEALMLEAGLLDAQDSLYSPHHISLMYHVSAAFRAHHIFRRDVDYIVQQERVVIVDEHTGRLMPGRRWSDGLHQAIEAKEGVPVQAENQTLASITFQNYFRLYQKLAGMTGTADTEAYEFHQIYGLEVIVIPTHQPVCRQDFPDKIYLTLAEKFEAIVAEIVSCRERGQPVLVGTASIENSELLSALLQQQKIPHQVLNAKRHEQEARIIAEAGRPGTVTLATNMAGRGTDIVLGGNLKAELASLPAEATADDRASRQAAWQSRYQAVVAAGGLHVIGSERHESRRIDNQLRGRAGRQGDPGSSRFYLSLQDNLLRIFAADRMTSLMQRLGMQPGEAIEHPWISRAVEKAQRKVEGHHFDIRKQLLEYDDVANEQRKIIYQQRQTLLVADAIVPILDPLWQDVMTTFVTRYIPPNTLEESWDIAALMAQLQAQFGLNLPVQEWLSAEITVDQLIDKITAAAREQHDKKETVIGAEALRQLEKTLMLQTLDHLWKDHLALMDHLRQGIHLRGFAQKNPKQEYKREAFDLFTHLLEDLKMQVMSQLSQMVIQAAANQMLIAPSEFPATPTANTKTMSRNQACHCGSGKKFKHCHGQLH